METSAIPCVYDGCVQPSRYFVQRLRKMTTFATIAPGLALADPAINARGAKSCALTSAGIKHVINIGSREEPLSTPFGASSYGEEQTDRKTVDFRLTAPSLAYFLALDEWCIQYVADNSERLFQRNTVLSSAVTITSLVYASKGLTQRR